MKKIIQDYIFDASAKTITSSDFTKLSEIALITNVTDNVIIYNFADPAKGATLAGNVLTLTFDTTAMADTDKLQIIAHSGTDIDRIGFAKAISNNIDTSMFTLRQTGSGMTVNQTGGNLVITTGTTARSETIIRGLNAYSGGIRARIQSILSQRIVNQQFFFELVDVVGDSLAYNITSATTVVVTLPASFGLSAQNVGQSMTLQQFSGTGTFLSGRYPIASVSGNDATFTVSGFAAGTGTVSAVGWNFYRLEYSNTTATNALWDTQRNGYSSGNTTATINTTASPGHMAIMTGNDGQAALHDQLIASATAIQTANRATRVVMVPDDAQVYLQIRVLNGSTAPATTTTWTIGQVSVGHFEAESVIVQDMRPTSFQTALPVEILRAPTIATTLTSTTITANTPGTAATNLGKARDSAIGATDTGVAMLGVRRDTPTAETPVAGDYIVPQFSGFGEQWVRLAGELADDAAFTLGTTRVVPNGAVAVTMDGTDPLAVSAEGDAAALRSDPNRILLVNQTHPRFFRASADYASAQTNATVVAAPGAGLSLWITDVIISNGATAGNITLLDGSGGSVVLEVYPAVNGGVAHSFRNPIKLTANTLLAITSTTVTTHSVTVTGYIAA